MLRKFSQQQVRKFWWTAPLLLALLVAVVVQSQGGSSRWITPIDQVEPVTEIVANPNDPHKPVYIRLGVIVDIGMDYIILEAKKLVGEGDERITALLAGDTSIIEIQIPSFMNKELTKDLNKSGDVIPRVNKNFEDLSIGQTVEVVSVSDMYGYKEVTATRIEYKVIIDTTDI